MKNKRHLCLMTFLVCSFCFPEQVQAQKKTVNVKRSRVVVHKRTKVRPVRTRRVAHYRYRNLPRWGTKVTSVGAGFVGIRFRGVGYRFHKGVWYRPKGKRFVIGRAPTGIRVTLLPEGYSRLVVGKNTYFYYYGTYYAKIPNTLEYEVVKAPIGAMITELPEGYEIIKVAGIAYYKFDDTYYEPKVDDKDEAYFKVVKTPQSNLD